MKLFLVGLFSFLFSIGFSQNFFKEKYDQLFPNNKSLQIVKLKAEKDSLKRLNDSLTEAQVNALDKINHLKKEVLILKTDLHAEQAKSKNANTELEQEVILLRDSINKISFPLVVCREEVVVKKGVVNPEIINTCLWRSYQIIEKGTPDYKGRYQWTTEISVKKGDSLIKIKNVDLFKPEKISELEKMINLRLEEDFKAMKISDGECFSRRRYYPTFKLKDMRITLNDNSEISFEIEYGLSEACFAVNSASTNLKIVDLKEYFVE
jgi:hypothetical protein